MVVLSEERPGGLPARERLSRSRRRLAAAVRDADRLDEPVELGASMPACRAVVATRLHAPDREAALLRRLRVLNFAGLALDDPEVIERAAERGRLLEPEELADVAAEDPEVEAGAAGRHGGLALAVARLARAGLQARRPARGAPLHVPVLRADARDRAARGLADREPRRPARLPPGRGLRGGDRQPRAGAHPPARSRTPSSRC